MVAGWLLLPSLSTAQVAIDNPKEYEGMGVTERLGDTVSDRWHFIDDRGKRVTIGDYLHKGKPVLVTLNYYSCPMLCNLILNGLNEGIKPMSWNAGDQFSIVTVSFNPRETFDLAAAKKKNYLKDLGRPEADSGWAFLVGAEDQSSGLAGELGFEYYWDEDRQEYAHPSTIMVLTEDGVVSRYLYGISFPTRDLRLALVEASEGKIGTTVDRLLLYCLHYDPDARGYVIVAGQVMKLGGVATLAVLGIFLGILWSREKLRRNRREDAVDDKKEPQLNKEGFC
jgi:protein SCO1/2